MPYLEGSVSSKLKILVLVPDIFGRGEVDATCASPTTFPIRLGGVTVASVQKMLLPDDPGSTSKVISRHKLLKVQDDKKNEGMWMLTCKETATCWNPLPGRGTGIERNACVDITPCFIPRSFEANTNLQYLGPKRQQQDCPFVILLLIHSSCINLLTLAAASVSAFMQDLHQQINPYIVMTLTWQDMLGLVQCCYLFCVQRHAGMWGVRKLNGRACWNAQRAEWTDWATGWWSEKRLPCP